MRIPPKLTFPGLPAGVSLVVTDESEISVSHKSADNILIQNLQWRTAPRFRWRKCASAAGEIIDLPGKPLVIEVVPSTARQTAVSGMCQERVTAASSANGSNRP